MAPRTLISKIPIWLLISTHAHYVLSLAVPAVTPSPSYFSVSKRADTSIATRYGIPGPFESSGPDDVVNDSDLARISEVFMAIAQLPDGSLSSVDSSVAPTPTPTNPLPSSTVYPESPPLRGPGLVVLSQPFPAIGSSTPVPTAASSTTSLPASNRTASPTKRVVILGSVIGSILLFTLCLFFILDPAITGRLFQLCHSRRRSASRVKENKDAVSSEDKWVPVAPLTNAVPLQSDRQTTQCIRNEGDLFTETAAPSPPSKFSMCSSEYSEPNRISALSSNSAYTSTPSRPTVSFVSGPTPTRPPRPPTADSPALTDSVYLACSDQPYVIVAPQSLTEAELNSNAPSKPPRRMLTPSEFFALHVPGILSGFGSSGGAPSKKQERSSTCESHLSSATKRESFHSRTKSAPLLGNVTISERGSTSNTELEFSIEGVREESMIQRISKHRRSRSASGWAYPDRSIPKKQRKEKV
ncbi:hypothetical protein JR316_0008970 [Psilocybe cubensis]|uniref:Uncharacterized protein n=2 Tax=Psilocybe cubensis TaxID=181762 RepID=A0ACB8GSR1_PSICU|nr:hypothetical protein JR316_0008970 [Psilocybe cubensis]KAH9478515.1 hypothetical protein JR316_0008970 [Psilocybe cubensis]